MSDRDVGNMGRAGRLLWVTGIVLTAVGTWLAMLEHAATPEIVGAYLTGIPAIAVGLWQDHKYRRERRADG